MKIRFVEFRHGVDALLAHNRFWIATLGGIGIVLGGLSANPARAENSPSFDCGKAHSVIEKTICSDMELSDLDAAMATAYSRLLKKYDHDRGASLRSGQFAWLRLISVACGISVGQPVSQECLKSVYRERQREFEEEEVWWDSLNSNELKDKSLNPESILDVKIADFAIFQGSSLIKPDDQPAAKILSTCRELYELTSGLWHFSVDRPAEGANFQMHKICALELLFRTNKYRVQSHNSDKRLLDFGLYSTEIYCVRDVGHPGSDDFYFGCLSAKTNPPKSLRSLSHFVTYETNRDGFCDPKREFDLDESITNISYISVGHDAFCIEGARFWPQHIAWGHFSSPDPDAQNELFELGSTLFVSYYDSTSKTVRFRYFKVPYSFSLTISLSKNLSEYN